MSMYVRTYVCMYVRTYVFIYLFIKLSVPQIWPISIQTNDNQRICNEKGVKVAFMA